MHYNRYLNPREKSAAANYNYVHNPMLVREKAGLFPLVML